MRGFHYLLKIGLPPLWPATDLEWQTCLEFLELLMLGRCRHYIP